MNARHYYRYSLMLLVLSAVFCPAAGVRAQYIKKETLPIKGGGEQEFAVFYACLLYTSPSPRDCS